MRRYDLRRVKTLQSSVDIFYLEYGGEEEDDGQEVGDGVGEDVVVRGREKRRDSLGRENCVASCRELVGRARWAARENWIGRNTEQAN